MTSQVNTMYMRGSLIPRKDRASIPQHSSACNLCLQVSEMLQPHSLVAGREEGWQFGTGDLERGGLAGVSLKQQSASRNTHFVTPLVLFANNTASSVTH